MVRKFLLALAYRRDTFCLSGQSFSLRRDPWLVESQTKCSSQRDYVSRKCTDWVLVSGSS